MITLALLIDLAAIGLCAYVCWRTCRANDRVWNASNPRRGLTIQVQVSVAWG